MFRFCIIFWSNMSSFTSIWNGSLLQLPRSSGLLFHVLESSCFDSVSFFDQVGQVSLLSGTVHFFGSLGALDYFWCFRIFIFRFCISFWSSRSSFTSIWNGSLFGSLGAVDYFFSSFMAFIFGFLIIFWWRISGLLVFWNGSLFRLPESSWHLGIIIIGFCIIKLL